MTTDLSRFAGLRADAIEPAVAAAIAEADAWVTEALALEDPSFDDVFRRLDHAGRIVRHAYGTVRGHPRPAPGRDRPRRREERGRDHRSLGVRAGRARRDRARRRLVRGPGRRARRWSSGPSWTGGAWTCATRASRWTTRTAGGSPSCATSRSARRPGSCPCTSAPRSSRSDPDETAGLPGVIVDGFGTPGEDGAWAVPLDDAVVTAVIESSTNRGLRRARGPRLAAPRPPRDPRRHRRGDGGAPGDREPARPAVVARPPRGPDGDRRDRRAPRRSWTGSSRASPSTRRREIQAMRRLLAEETGDPDAVSRSGTGATSTGACGLDPGPTRTRSATTCRSRPASRPWPRSARPCSACGSSRARIDRPGTRTCGRSTSSTATPAR